MIAFDCTSCGKSLKVKDELAGKKVKCPGCQKPNGVPQPAASVSPPPAAPGEERTLPPKAAAIPDDRTLPPKEAGKKESISDAGGLTDLGAGKRETTQAFPMTEHSAELTDFLAAPQQPDELGRLGGFRILKILGHGGMGVVFQGEDPKLGRKVAIKAMLPHLAESKSGQQRFLREARTAAALEHDNIVPILQVGEERGVPFIAMPFLKGEPLDERLNRHKLLPVAEVLRIGRETANGLAAAHEAGLIHRDIKPANLWLEGAEGRVKILDFGLARATADSSQLTQQGAIIGTPAYMAPEQGAGEQADHRCDLFSLGCVLYRLSTGQMPFKGKDTVSTIVSVAMDNPEPPAEIRSEVPVALSDLVMQLLAKKPEDRPESAKVVAEALQQIAAEFGAIAATSLMKPRQQRTSSAAAKAADRTQLAGPAKKQLPAGWLIAGGVLGLAVLGLVAFLLQRPSDNPAEPLRAAPPASVPFTLDHLDPSRIGEEQRCRWHPKELVAIVGNQHRNGWGAFTTLAVSPNGKWLSATSGAGLRTDIYNAATLQLRWDSHDFKQSGSWNYAPFLPDGQRLFLGGRVWNLTGEQPIAEAQVPAEFQGYDAAATARPVVATAHHDGNIRVYEFAGGVLRRLHSFAARAAGQPVPHPFDYPLVCFGDSEARLLVTRVGDRYCVWDLTGEQPKELVAGNASRIAVSPQKRLLAVHHQEELSLWNLATTPPQKIANWLKNPRVGGVEGLEFALDGKRLLVVGGGKTAVWSTAPGQDVPLSVVNAGERTLVLSADGKRLFMLGRQLRVFDYRGIDWEEQDKLPIVLGRPIFSPDGRELLTQPIHGFHTTSLWDLSGPAPVERPLPSSVRDCLLLGWRDGALIMVAGSNRLLSWKGTGEPEMLADLGGAVRIPALSLDGNTLAFTRQQQGESTAIEIWNLGQSPPARATIETKSRIDRLQLSADGQRLTAGGFLSASQLFVRDSAAWKDVWQTELTFRDGSALSPAGNRVATIHGFGGGSIWDASVLPPRLLRKVSFHDPYNVEFSRDGERVVISGSKPGLLVAEAAAETPPRVWPIPCDSATFAPDGRHLAIQCEGCVWILRLAGPAAMPVAGGNP